MVKFFISKYSKSSITNTDGSFTWNDSKSFLIPNEILLIAQENEY